MQPNTRFRIFGLLLFLFCVAATAYNWLLLITERRYYLQASGLAPVGALFGLALLFSPSAAFKARPEKKGAVATVLVAGIIGMILGGINFYLMDHYK